MTGFSIFPDISTTFLRTRFLLFAILVAVCPLQPTFAVDPNRAFSQYLRDRWTIENGFPGRQVNAFAQTPDGYLWIGTAEGLFRFDGFNFVSTQELSPGSAPLTGVLGLLTDGSGTLWVRTQGSILRRHNGTFEDVTSDLAPGSFINAMSRAGDGGILLSNLKSGEILLGKNGFRTVALSPTLKTALVMCLAQTSDGKIWLGTRADGLFYVNNGQIVAASGGLPERKINSLLPMRDGTLWIGTDDGLIFWNGTAITPNSVASSLSHVQISALLQDRDGNVWAGTPHGLVRLNSKGSVLQEDAKHAAGEITSLFEDREGDLWIGSAQGIERLRDSAFVTYSASEGLPAESNGPLYVDSGGRTWFGPSNGGLYWLRDGSVTAVAIGGLRDDPVYSISGYTDQVWIGRRLSGLTHIFIDNGATRTKTYRQSDGLAQDSVSAVRVGRDGSVWAGTLSGGVSRLKDATFTTYSRSNGLASNSVASIEEGHDGTMWFATRGGLSAFSGDRLKTYTPRDGLPSDDVTSVEEDSQANLWIGSSGGLAVLAANTSVGIQGLQRYVPDPVFGIAEDKNGFLWILTSKRICRIDRARLLSGSIGPGDIREYGLADGLRSTEGVRRERSIVTDSHGAIWFSLSRGISVIDPSQARDELPPIAQIESASADSRPIAMQAPVRIPGPLRRIAFNYTGLSLSVPQRIRFRYMLDGFDHDWSEATSARQAIYTNLGPGRYRFRVMSSNRDGVWTGTEAAFPFNIDPAFWQTWWFRLLCVVCVLAAVWMFHTLRMRQVAKRMQARLEERIQERERLARNLHDTLLQGVISASIQLDVANDRLPEDSPAKPLVKRVLELMQLVTEEGRNSIRSLRLSRPESNTLEQAIGQLGESLASDTDVEFHVIVEGRPRPLQSATWDEAYHIASEAVTNAFRHARAGKIEVEVEYAVLHFNIVVRDDGCGIDVNVLGKGREGHWGLPGMRERAEQIGARLQVLSRPDSGTEVELRIPGKVAFESSTPRRWFRWWERFFTAKQAVNRPSTK